MKTYLEIQDILKAPGNWTQNEEADVFEYYEKNKTIELRNLIVEKNYGLIRSCIKWMHGTYVENDDLSQIGAMALIKAVDYYKPNKKSRFSTYACRCIKSQMSRYICDNSRTIRIPVHNYEDYYKIQKISNAYFTVNGEMPDMDYLAEKTGFSMERIKKLYGMFEMTATMSLDAGFSKMDSDEPMKLSMRIGDEDSDSRFSYDTDMSIFKNALKEILTEEEYKYISLYYGLDDNIVRTLNEVGKIMGVSRETVRKNVTAVISRKLRLKKNKQKFENLLEYY